MFLCQKNKKREPLVSFSIFVFVTEDLGAAIFEEEICNPIFSNKEPLAHH